MGKLAKSRARAQRYACVIPAPIPRNSQALRPNPARRNAQLHTALGAKYRADRVCFLIGVPAKYTLVREVERLEIGIVNWRPIRLSI